MSNTKVYVGESRNGKGVFAGQDLKPGECILEKIKGKLLSFKECVELSECEVDLEAYPLQLKPIAESECYLMPESPIFYLNHQCFPGSNAFINDSLQLIAIKEIPKGSEITYDYSQSMNEGGQWTLEKCNCGSTHCRGSAQDFIRLEISLQREMVSKGLVMSHIYKDLDESLQAFIPSSKLFVGQNALGNAVFAQKLIKKGDRIFRFSGPVLKESGIPIEVAARHYYMEISQDEWLAASEMVDDYCNHSCEPNSGGLITSENTVWLNSIKDIQPGEEIMWDYSTFSTTNLDLTCLCGSTSCRGVIGSYFSLNDALKKRYISEGIVPEFVLSGRLTVKNREPT